MKRRRLLILSSIIPCALALSGCFLTDLFKQKAAEIIVNGATIDVVSNLKINLHKQPTKQLSPTLSSDVIKNPEFVYTSSDSSVAKVSSSGAVTGLKVGKATITVALKVNKNIKASVAVTVVDKATTNYDYTIMFYMCGSDLEYESDSTSANEQGFFSRDIQELLSVTGLPSNVKILIETGGTKKWNLSSSYLEGATKISSSSLQRWEVNNTTNKLKLVETLSTNKMAKESSFEEFLNWGLDDYEGEQMGVVISGHGGGINGCAVDDNYTYKYGDQYYGYTLRTHEVAAAAKTALANSDRDKFTWIGYDCCLMQCADIASVNADYFEYMVASQESEIATGWNHDYYLPKLKTNSKIEPEDFLPEICDGFLAENHSNSESGRDICYQTLSVLDLSKMETLTSTFNSFSQTLGTSASSYNKAVTAFKSSLNSFGEKCYGLCDMKSLMQSFTAYDTSAVESAINEVVIKNAYCSKYSTAPCGLNAFLPESLNRKYDLQVGKEDYENVNDTKFTTWQKMCLNNGNFGW